jgi:NAD+ kinase
MTMPIDTILVRHGQSESNVANRLSRSGDNRHFTDEFRNRHSSSFRLTIQGEEEAKAAGAWIRENISLPLDRYMASEYIRAMETAALLGLPKAKWYTEFYLREREWGDLDVKPDDERRQEFAESMRRREIDPFYWVPPGGQSIADLCLRIDRVLHTLHRECGDKRVIVVCHGEVMWAFRVRLERMSQERYKELDFSDHPHDRIHNCQILHYTRRNPYTGELSRYANWMRSICPWDLSRSSNEWQEIRRPTWSNEELLERVHQVKRMVE